MMLSANVVMEVELGSRKETSRMRVATWPRKHLEGQDLEQRVELFINH